MAVPVWGGLMRQLSLVPDDRPRWQEFDQIARGPNSGAMISGGLGTAGPAFPRWLLEAALEVCQTRGAVGRRSGRDVLVHTDFLS